MNIGKKDVMWSYISLAMIQGVNIVLLPIILKYLNSAELGLWYTFTSLYGLAMLIDFGFQTVIARNISYIWSGAKSINSTGINIDKKEEFDLRYFIKLLSTVKFTYYIMGLIILIFLINFGTLYLVEVTNGEIDVQSMLIAWLFYMMSIVLNIAFSFWNAILKGIGAIKTYNQILVVTKVVQLILSTVSLILGYGIIGVSFSYFISVVVNRLLQSISYYRYSVQTQLTKGKIKVKYDKQIFQSLIPNTIKTGINSLASYLIIGFPIILCSYFLSLEVSGQFGLVNQIITLILALSNAYFNTYLSKFNYLRVKQENKQLVKLFLKSIFTNYLFNFFAFSCLIIMGDYILEFIGTNYKLLDLVPLLIIITYRFLYNNQLLFTAFLTTKNKIPYYMHFILSSVLTVVIQSLLLNILGRNILNLILPLLVIQLFFNNWYWVVYVIKDMGRDLNEKKINNE